MTQENKEKKYIGHTDARLNETGRLQARTLGEKLKNIKIDRIYASDLSRCADTAREIARERDILPILLPVLRELHFGEWEGKMYEEIMAMDGRLATAWYDNPFAQAPPGGETLLEFGNRVDKKLQEIIGECQEEETLVLVSHGGPIRWFQCKWIHQDPFQYWYERPPGHGEFLIFDFHGATWSEEVDLIIE